MVGARREPSYVPMCPRHGWLWPVAWLVFVGLVRTATAFLLGPILPAFRSAGGGQLVFNPLSNLAISLPFGSCRVRPLLAKLQQTDGVSQDDENDDENGTATLEDALAALQEAFPVKPGESNRVQLREFWASQGLSVEKMDLLLWGGEVEPRLRQIDYLVTALEKIEALSANRDVALQACAKTPELLLLEPHVLQDRLVRTCRYLCNVAPRLLMSRGSGLLLYDIQEIKARERALQAAMPEVNMRELCAKTPWLLVREDSVQIVKRVLSIIKRELPESDLIRVLFMNPFLLSSNVEAIIAQRKARLEALLPGVDARRLLSRAPGLLTVVDAWLEERLQAFRDIFPETRELVAVISACPQAIARRDVSLSSQRLQALKERLPRANLTAMVERCPSLVNRWLEQGCLVQRIDSWCEAFPSLAMEDIIAKEGQRKLVVLEQTIREGDKSLGRLNQELVIRRAPNLLLLEEEVLRERARALRKVVGGADLLSLTHACPRLLKLDYRAVIVPKARTLRQLLPTQDEASLLRTAPHAFFYSTFMIEDKMGTLRQVLPSVINVTAMVSTAPSLLSLDIRRNITPKVAFLSSVWEGPPDELTRLLECRPQILTNSFLRVARMRYFGQQLSPASTREECEKAFDLCCQTLEELTANCPGYLGYLESQDTTNKPQSLLEYRALEEALSDAQKPQDGGEAASPSSFSVEDSDSGNSGDSSGSGSGSTRQGRRGKDSITKKEGLKSKLKDIVTKGW